MARKNAIMSIILTGVMSTSFVSAYHNSVQKPVEVSSGLMYFLKDNDYVKDNNIKTYLDDDIYLDVNENTLGKIDNLVISACDFDFNELKYLTDLNYLTINNAQFLTEDDLNKIYSLNDVNTKIFFDNLSSFLNADIDIDLLNQNTRIVINNENTNELSIYGYYKFIEKLNPMQREKINVLSLSDDQLEDAKNWDLEIANIIDHLDLDSYDNEYDKLVTIIRFVVDNYDYDYDVDEYFRTGNNKNGEYKIKMYNDYVLSTFFDNKNSYGVCCNFSALTKVLANYIGIDIDSVNGDYISDVSGYHSWNVYNDGDNKHIIDVTYLNSEYSNHSNDMYSEYAKTSVLLDYYSKEYHADDTNYDKINRKYNIYGEEYYNKEVKKLIKLKEMLGICSMIILSSNIIYNKKKTKTK